MFLWFRPKKLSKSKLECSKTPRNLSARKPLPSQDTIRKLDLVSKKTLPYLTPLLSRFQNPTIRHWGSLRRQEVPIHLICFHQRKNLQVSVFKEEFNILIIGVSSFPIKCQEPLSLEEIISITSRSTIDSRRDITTYQLTAPHASEEPRPEMLLLLDNADQSPRLLDSTWSELRRRKSRVTLERHSSCSEQSGSS